MVGCSSGQVVGALIVKGVGDEGRTIPGMADVRTDIAFGIMFLSRWETSHPLGPAVALPTPSSIGGPMSGTRHPKPVGLGVPMAGRPCPDA